MSRTGVALKIGVTIRVHRQARGSESAKNAGTVVGMGPAPASTSEVPERDPPHPVVGGDGRNCPYFDDPCPGSFGTEQPEPVVFKAIYHYATRVGHFQTPTPRKPTATTGTHRLVGSNLYDAPLR